MRKWVRCIGLIVVLSSFGSTTHAGPVEDEAAIRQRFERWRNAFNARDVDGACDLFAPDLSYSVPGIVQGDRQRMCDNLRRLLSSPGLSLSYAEPMIHEIIVSGSIAIVRLRWTLTAQIDGRRNVTTEEGLDILVRQADGRWSIARFIAF